MLRIMDAQIKLLGGGIKLCDRHAKSGNPEEWDRMQDKLSAILTLTNSVRDEVKQMIIGDKHE